MKKILLLAYLLITFNMHAQVYKTVSPPDGNTRLTDLLTQEEQQTTTHLTIIGSLAAPDLKTLRLICPNSNMWICRT